MTTKPTRLTFLNQKGVILQGLVLSILLVGIVATVYLLNRGNLKLFSRASEFKNLSSLNTDEFSVGFNVTGITNYGKGDITPASSADHVEKDLQEIKNMGARLVRVYVGNNKISDEEAAIRLDQFLTKAKTYDISVIISFIDFYNTGYNPKDTDQFYTDSWQELKTLGRGFFSGGYKDRYLSFVKTIIDRNKHHSNIYAWEPGNELSFRQDPGMFLLFMKDVTGVIKKADSSHKVATGMINASEAGLSPNSYAVLTDVNIITIHTYDGDRGGDQDVTWAVNNGKLAIIEEVGFSASPFTDDAPACDPAKLIMDVSASDIKVGDIITLSMSGEQGSTHLSDTFSPNDLLSCPGFPTVWPTSQQCDVLKTGTAKWIHSWKNCSPNLGCNVTSNNCSKEINLTIGSGVTQVATESAKESTASASQKSVLGAVSTKNRSQDMQQEINFWKGKGVSAILQWGFVAKGIQETSNGDFKFGMDTIWHSDYDALADVFKQFVPLSCPVNVSCCSKPVTKCTSSGLDNKNECPEPFKWCYAGVCVHKDFNPQANICVFPTDQPVPSATPPVTPTPAPSAKADLTIERILLTSAQRVGSTNDVNVMVRNNGQQSTNKTATVKVQTFAPNGDLLGSCTGQLKSLSPGAQSSVGIRKCTKFLTTGKHKVIAIVDSTNVISESNESNNEFTVSIDVKR